MLRNSSAQSLIDLAASEDVLGTASGRSDASLILQKK
jgi:hypothetical protein